MITKIHAVTIEDFLTIDDVNVDVDVDVENEIDEIAIKQEFFDNFDVDVDDDFEIFEELIAHEMTKANEKQTKKQTKKQSKMLINKTIDTTSTEIEFDTSMILLDAVFTFQQSFRFSFSSVFKRKVIESIDVSRKKSK